MINEPWNNRLYSIKERLELAIGGTEFRDVMIINLRTQVKALRALLLVDHTVEEIDNIQFAHLDRTLRTADE
jgi:hypothetical protein